MRGTKEERELKSKAIIGLLGLIALAITMLWVNQVRQDSESQTITLPQMPLQSTKLSKMNETLDNRLAGGDIYKRN